jgi:hypothetical protein
MTAHCAHSRSPLARSRAFLILRETKMTKSDDPKPAPLPLLLVYGRPTSVDLPQASWFRIEDRIAVAAAAHALKLTVIDIASEGERALLAGVHEGVLKAGRRLIVGSVAVNVYKRIEEHAAKSASEVVAGSRALSEQNTNISDATSTTSLAPAPTGKAASAANPSPVAAATTNLETAAHPNPWDALRTGARVLAAYWNEDHEFAGFWLATVKRIEKGEFTLEWIESPEYPPFKIRPKNIAVPHTEFQVSGK